MLNAVTCFAVEQCREFLHHFIAKVSQAFAVLVLQRVQFLLRLSAYVLVALRS